MPKWFSKLWDFLFGSSEEVKPKYNVGIAKGTAILDNGDIIHITRRGRIHYIYSIYVSLASYRFHDTMNEKWIYADDDVYYNRDYIKSYTVEVIPYWVNEDGTPA